MPSIEELRDEWLTARDDMRDYDSGAHRCTSKPCQYYLNGLTADTKYARFADALRSEGYLQAVRDLVNRGH